MQVGLGAEYARYWAEDLWAKMGRICHYWRITTDDEGAMNMTSGTDRISALASSVAAPAIIIGAATVYFAGTVYRDKLLANFGLSGTALQESLQATMASGYLAILGMLVVFVPGVVSGMASRFFVPGIPTSNGSEVGFLRRHIVFFRTLFLVTSLLLFAGAGWYAGVRAAEGRYYRLVTDVSQGCKRCFLYNTARGRVVGVPLGQDANVAILVTRSGVVVLPANSIRAIRAINRKPAFSTGTFAFE